MTAGYRNKLCELLQLLVMEVCMPYIYLQDQIVGYLCKMQNYRKWW